MNETISGLLEAPKLLRESSDQKHLRMLKDSEYQSLIQPQLPCREAKAGFLRAVSLAEHKLDEGKIK